MAKVHGGKPLGQIRCLNPWNRVVGIILAMALLVQVATFLPFFLATSKLMKKNVRPLQEAPEACQINGDFQGIGGAVKNATDTGDLEFPYKRSCKKSDLYNFLEQKRMINCKTGKKTNNFKIALAYHVGMVNNWRTILGDQLTTLKECGLMGIVDEFIVSYANGDKAVLFDAMAASMGKYFNINALRTSKATGAPWEGQAMNMIHGHCLNQTAPQSTIVFYFHNKGASKWKENWKSHLNSRASYAHSLYWRKYLEYFLLERPQLCIEQIFFQNASTCGANFHFSMKNHYSGNFWSASCEYIVKLRPITSDDTNYLSAEFWLGKAKGRRSSFHSTAKSLYENLILPEEYAFDDSVWYDG